MQTKIDIFSGEELKRIGMEKAEANAGLEWNIRAFEFLCNFAQVNRQFMAEEVRVAAEDSGQIEIPPSKRAWGSVIAKAKRDKIITHIGYNQVDNPLAHKANASVWRSNIYQQ